MTRGFAGAPTNCARCGSRLSGPPVATWRGRRGKVVGKWRCRCGKATQGTMRGPTLNANRTRE